VAAEHIYCLGVSSLDLGLDTGMVGHACWVRMGRDFACGLSVKYNAHYIELNLKNSLKRIRDFTSP
jgi:hypothetical protein